MTDLALEMDERPEMKRGLVRGWLEAASIFLLMPIGGILGGLSGFPPLVAISSVVLPLLAATFYLRREGTTWRSLTFGDRLTVPKLIAYAAAALATTALVVIGINSLLRMAGMPPADISMFEALLKDNFTMYLWLLIPVAWGSAAIGEELLARGFLLHRFEGMHGTASAVILQAAVFAGAHFYQGLTGVLTIFGLALVFGFVYLRSGRNLLPLIIAHGLIDTFSLTMIYLGHGDKLV